MLRGKRLTRHGRGLCKSTLVDMYTRTGLAADGGVGTDEAALWFTNAADPGAPRPDAAAGGRSAAYRATGLAETRDPGWLELQSRFLPVRRPGVPPQRRDTSLFFPMPSRAPALGPGEDISNFPGP